MNNTNTERCIRDLLERDFKCVDKFDVEYGGIYVETTEDPRGFMFGDKTRKIYEATSSEIKSLVGLNVLIAYIHDGREIKVSVCNPQDIGMMLLSKNDDVGSSIQYADINVSYCAKLIAKMGEHVCIGSIDKGSWVRVRIFPGKNIIDNWMK